MKSPKRIAAILLAGFLAFAPPGTLIFLFALLVGLLGHRWGAAAAVALCLGACAALLLLLRRRRRAHSRAEESAHTDAH
jgi:hypothetical protein